MWMQTCTVALVAERGACLSGLHTLLVLLDLADMLVRKWLCSLCGCLLLYPWQQYPPKNETAVPVAAMNAVRATFFTFNS